MMHAGQRAEPFTAPSATHEVAGHRAWRGSGRIMLLALLPFALLVATLVLLAMAASSAAATGGCGGG